jgi:hypothetical protein
MDPEIFREIRKRRSANSLTQRERADKEYVEAAQLASEHALHLIQHTFVHYQLKKPGEWCYDIYPGNRRIYKKKDSKTPFLKLPADWTLIDVVKAAINKIKN